MSQKLIQESFRQTFKTIDQELLRWFPGHMAKGTQQMQKRLKLVDCIVEVHDARIPLSGRNADFKYTVSGLKPHILVLNKKDLIDNSTRPKIEERLKNDSINHVLFTNCKDHKDSGVRKILPAAEKLIMNTQRFNRENSQEFNIMVIGVPNVGKSSLINCLRNYHLKKASASPVGALPGITRSVLNRIKISHEPLVYLYDTPGILSPNIKNTETGLKLALCATLQDHLVGETVIADYLLYWLNKHKKFTYVKHFQLEKASDVILDVLLQISKRANKMVRMKSSTGEYCIRPDFDSAAKMFLKSFRIGELGKIMLDRDLIQL